MLEKAKGCEYKSRWQEACQIYQVLLKKDPENWEARIRLAQLYERYLKDRARARLEYQKVRESAPAESVWYRRATEAIHSLPKGS